MSKIVDFKLMKLYIDEDTDRYSYLLKADFDQREVTTNCGDSYNDISISFDDFIKFAKAIEEQDKIYNKEKRNNEA